MGHKNGIDPKMSCINCSSLKLELFLKHNFSYIWAASCGRTMKPFDLSAKCCTVKDIAASFTKLREICMPGMAPVTTVLLPTVNILVMF